MLAENVRSIKGRSQFCRIGCNLDLYALSTHCTVAGLSEFPVADWIELHMRYFMLPADNCPQISHSTVQIFSRFLALPKTVALAIARILVVLAKTYPIPLKSLLALVLVLLLLRFLRPPSSISLHNSRSPVIGLLQGFVHGDGPVVSS